MPARERSVLRRLVIAACGLLLWGSAPAGTLTGHAQQEIETRVSTLESRLERVEDEVDEYGDRAAGAGLIVFVIGCFCALWAQNSGRSAWLWFFLGCFFHVITLLVLLSKNSNDLANRSV